jgi:hypothetical protein
VSRPPLFPTVSVKEIPAFESELGWIELFEAGRYREALRASVLSGTCSGPQMQAMAALVIVEAMDK